MENKDSKSKNGQDYKSSGDRAIERFCSAMIDRMKAMKASDWRQGWTNGKGTMLGMPQNLSGRNYSGSNSFFLQMDTAMNAYRTPVYLTFMQAQKENIRIKKGAQSMPVIYWDLNIKDDRGKRVSEADYRQMSRGEQKKCEVRPFLRAFSVFNVDQTNLEEVNKEKYDAIVDRFRGPQLRDTAGMYENRALDRMFERQEWICRVQTTRLWTGRSTLRHVTSSSSPKRSNLTSARTLRKSSRTAWSITPLLSMR
jgi:hypothetical protein